MMEQLASKGSSTSPRSSISIFRYWRRRSILMGGQSSTIQKFRWNMIVCMIGVIKRSRYISLHIYSKTTKNTNSTSKNYLKKSVLNSTRTLNRKATPSVPQSLASSTVVIYVHSEAKVRCASYVERKPTN